MPGFPLPIGVLSIFVIGNMCFAEPVKKTSSAVSNCFFVIFFSVTWILFFLAIFNTNLRVIPGKMPSDGVNNLSFFTIKMLLVVHSKTLFLFIYNISIAPR